MKHLKKHFINEELDRSTYRSARDMGLERGDEKGKKISKTAEELLTRSIGKELDGEKHLSKDELPKKSQKPSNKKLDAEKSLSKTEKEGSSRKPSNNKLDGEKFLSSDDEVEKVPEKVSKHLKKFNVDERTDEKMSNIKTFEYYYFEPDSDENT